MDFESYRGSATSGASAQLGSNINAPKPLESLALAAQRVNNATVTVQNFLDRWHGPTPECADSAGNAPISFPHSGNLDRLFSALDRLEERLEALNAIG